MKFQKIKQVVYERELQARNGRDKYCVYIILNKTETKTVPSTDYPQNSLGTYCWNKIPKEGL